MGNPRDHQIVPAAPPSMPGKARLLAAMERSEREVAAGLTISLADVLAELDAVANGIEARRHARPACISNRF